MQKILGYLRKAIDKYNMIDEGDKIAVALSGGKDSITLFDSSFLNKTCKEIGVEFVEAKSYIKEIVFDIRKEKNPCSLCANLRRGILNSTAIEYGCNKLALGHNEDDVLETFFLNMLYAGNLNTFSPVSYMDRSKITLIRPLVYTPEKEIKKFIKRNNISVMPKNCIMDGVSKREYMKDLLYKLTVEIPNVRANLIGAIKRAGINGWKE